MTSLLEFYEERYKEVEQYFEFLSNIDEAANSGLPKFEATGQVITSDQRKIVTSGFYLQLYNLVEATVLRFFSEIDATVNGASCRPGELSESVRKLWVKSAIKAHENLNPENRLESALMLVDLILRADPIEDFVTPRGGGGNWDDKAIEDMSRSLGFAIPLPRRVETLVKRHRLDDLGALGLVKRRRNELAHGNISFIDCASEVTISDMREVKEAVDVYMRVIVARFDAFILNEVFSETLMV